MCAKILLTEQIQVSKLIRYFRNDASSIPDLTGIDNPTLNVIRRVYPFHDGMIIDGVGANLVVVNLTFGDVRVVHGNERNASILLGIHNNFPVELWHGKLTRSILNVQPDVNIIVIDIKELANSTCPSVHVRIKTVFLYVVSGTVFKVEPVVTIEGPPLWHTIIEVICRVLLYKNHMLGFL